MAQPLTKHFSDGSCYSRPATIDAALDAALDLDIATLIGRLAVCDHTSPEYLPSECLVHLIRRARRKGDDIVNTLLPPLLKRCEALLQSGIPNSVPSADHLREEVLGYLGELFALDGTGEDHDELDFFEVRFNAAFRTLRINVFRSETLHTSRHVSLTEGPEQGDSAADDDAGEWLVDQLRRPATQASDLAYRNLVRAIEALPDDQRQALALVCVLGYKIESDTPDQITAATLCGVTGRTIRHRLSRAAKALSRFKEAGQ